MSASKLSRFRLYYEKVEHRSPKAEAKAKGHKVRDVSTRTVRRARRND